MRSLLVVVMITSLSLYVYIVEYDTVITHIIKA